MAYPISTSLHLMFDKSFERPIEEQVTRIVKNCFEYLDFNFLDWFWDKRSPFVGDGLDRARRRNRAQVGRGVQSGARALPVFHLRS